MNASVERGDRLLAPSGVQFDVLDVDQGVVECDLAVLEDGTPARLRNVQRYSLAVVEASRGWEVLEDGEDVVDLADVYGEGGLP